MTRREGISPSLRFAILRRDGFACRYCGSQAPSVRLHVDHVIPVSHGGKTTATNLVAACEQCNMGKGGDRGPQSFMNSARSNLPPAWKTAEHKAHDASVKRRFAGILKHHFQNPGDFGGLDDLSRIFGVSKRTSLRMMAGTSEPSGADLVALIAAYPQTADEIVAAMVPGELLELEGKVRAARHAIEGDTAGR